MHPDLIDEYISELKAEIERLTSQLNQTTDPSKKQNLLSQIEKKKKDLADWTEKKKHSNGLGI